MPLGDEYGGTLGEVEVTGTHEARYGATIDQDAARQEYAAEQAVKQEVESIQDVYVDWAEEQDIWTSADTVDVEAAYSGALGTIRSAGLEPSARSIARYCGERTVASWDGLFVSALCNESNAPTFSLPDMGATAYVGYRNTKDITIRGNVDRNAGMRMAGGTLVITGDAGRGVGKQMASGRIEVHGDGTFAEELPHDQVEDVGAVRRYRDHEAPDQGIMESLRNVLEEGFDAGR